MLENIEIIIIIIIIIFLRWTAQNSFLSFRKSFFYYYYLLFLVLSSPKILISPLFYIGTVVHWVVASTITNINCKKHATFQVTNCEINESR